MTTYQTFLGGHKTRIFEPKMFIVRRKVYFANQALAEDDIQQVISVLADDIVLASWIKVIEKCDSNSLLDLGYGVHTNYYGNQLAVDATGHARAVLYGSLAWDAYFIADKSELTNEIEIEGARFGDHVTVSSGLDCADMALTGEVIHDNMVAIHLINNTGSGLDIPVSQTMKIAVNKAPMASTPLVLSAADTLDIKAGTAITKGIIEVNALVITE